MTVTTSNISLLGTMAANNLCAAAESLRKAQKAYMADRGNNSLGKKVAEAAKELDECIEKYKLARRDM